MGVNGEFYLRLRRFAELARFGLVGGASTLTYALISLALLGAGLGATSASALAYAAAGVLSYSGHKFFTFASPGRHGAEAPRFVVLYALGFATALAAPEVTVRLLHFDARAAILFTCLAIPAVNYFAMKYLVFAPPSRSSDDSRG